MKQSIYTDQPDTVKLIGSRLDCMQRLHELSTAATGHPYFVQHIRLLQKQLDEWDRKIFKIVLIGQYSSGKSTFLNALIGQAVLAQRTVETTATATCIFPVSPDDARAFTADVHFLDGRQETLTGLDHDPTGLNKYTTLLEDHGKVAREVERVQLFWSLPMLETRVAFVDTPGDNGLASHVFAVTKQEINEATAVIFLLAEKGLDQQDFQLLSHIRAINAQPRIFFVLNKIDMIEPAERESHLAFVRQEIIKHIGVQDIRFYALSALKALAAKQRADPLQLQASGFDSFERDLYAYVSGSQIVEDAYSVILGKIESLAREWDEEQEENRSRVSKREEAREKKRKRLYAHVDIEYRELEESLQQYLDAETQRLVERMEQQSAQWMVQTESVTRRNVEEKIKEMQQAVHEAAKWPAPELGRRIQETLTCGLQVINDTLQGEMVHFFTRAEDDLESLAAYIPKRNEELFRRIELFAGDKKNSESQFDELLSLLQQRQFSFQELNPSQFQREFERMVTLENSIEEHERNVHVLDAQLTNAQRRIAEERTRKTKAEERYQHERKQMGERPKAISVMYEVEVERECLGKIIDWVLGKRTVKRSGYNDDRGKAWDQKLGVMQKGYETDISYCSQQINKLTLQMNTEEEKKAKTEAIARRIKRDKDEQIRKVLDAVLVSQQQYAQETAREVMTFLRETVTLILDRCQSMIHRDRDDLMRILREYIGRWITDNKKQIDMSIEQEM